jgi:hypothetical protein
MELYRSNPKYNHIRTYFQKTYPQYSNEFSKTSLREKFLKIIRITVKRIKEAMAHFGG